MNNLNNSIESLPNLINTLSKYLNNQINQSPNLLVSILIQIAPFLITAFISIFTLRSSNNLNKKISNDNINLSKEINTKSINEKNIKLEQQKLQEFYYPFYILLKKNSSLFELFAQEEKKDENFSTLIKLLEGHEFSNNDYKILEKIIEVNNDLNNLIITKGGHVDNNDLQLKLSQLSTHFTVINLAFKGDIRNESYKYKNIIFPSSITDSIENEIKKIESNINNLSNS